MLSSDQYPPRRQRCLPPNATFREDEETPVQIEIILVNLNSADLRLVSGSGSKLNGDLTTGHSDRESFVDSGQGGARSCNNVEVSEHRSAIDGDIEDALSGRGPIDFCKLKDYVVASVCDNEMIRE